LKRPAGVKEPHSHPPGVNTEEHQKNPEEPRRTPEEHQKNPEEPRRTQKEKNTSPPVYRVIMLVVK
jgi:hypothetical protein